MTNNFFVWKTVCLLSVGRLVRICENHASILREASKLRLLNDGEINFLSSFDLYQDGFLGVIELRSAALKYFKE